MQHCKLEMYSVNFASNLLALNAISYNTVVLHLKNICKCNAIVEICDDNFDYDHLHFPNTSIFYQYTMSSQISVSCSISSSTTNAYQV